MLQGEEWDSQTTKCVPISEGKVVCDCGRIYQP